MPKKLNLTGTSGKEYDLDQLSKSGTRDNTEEALVVQIWYWNPNLNNSHKYPNPPNPKLGQIWLSKLIPLSDVELYKRIAEEE